MQIKKSLTLFLYLFFIVTPSKACDPVSGDAWYQEIFKLNDSAVARQFKINNGFIYPTNNFKCMIPAPNQFPIEKNGLKLIDFCFDKKEQILKDNRAENVKIPAPESCDIKVYCDHQKFTIKLKLQYVKNPKTTQSKEYAKFYLSQIIDKKTLPPYLKLVSGGAQSGMPPYYRIQTKSEAYFCSTGHASLKHGAYVSDFYYNQLKNSHPEIWNKENPPKAIDYSFEVFCYKRLINVAGKIHYSLNKNYDPWAHKKSVQACHQMYQNN